MQLLLSKHIVEAPLSIALKSATHVQLRTDEIPRCFKLNSFKLLGLQQAEANSPNASYSHRIAGLTELSQSYVSMSSA